MYRTIARDMSSTRDIERDERNGRGSASQDVNEDSSDGPHWGFGLIGGAIGFVVGGIVATQYWKSTPEPEQRAAPQRPQLRQSFETSGERRERRRRVRDEDLREDQTCVVCWTNAREIILLPCGHVCVCEDCSVSIGNNCPICRKEIRQRTAAYIS